MFVCGTTAALLMPLFLIEKLMLIGALLLVLIVELMNSAIEAVVDRVSLEYHPLSKNAKDIGSAAVLLTCVLAAATWLTILAEHFYLQPADGKLNFPRSKYALIIDRG